MNPLKPYLPALIIIALVGLYAGHRGIVRYEVSTAVKVANAIKDTHYKGLLLQAHSNAKKAEETLESKAEKNQAALEAKITTISSELSAALHRLHNRPARPTPSDNTKAPPATEACTGGQLYREDGEFLIREASRANEVVVERDFFYKAYEDARKTLDEYSKQR